MRNITVVNAARKTRSEIIPTLVLLGNHQGHHSHILMMGVGAQRAFFGLEFWPNRNFLGSMKDWDFFGSRKKHKDFLICRPQGIDF